jgi:hypothetical protein
MKKSLLCKGPETSGDEKKITLYTNTNQQAIPKLIFCTCNHKHTILFLLFFHQTVFVVSSRNCVSGFVCTFVKALIQASALLCN